MEQFRNKVHASLVLGKRYGTTYDVEMHDGSHLRARRSSRKQERIDLYEVAIDLYQMQEGGFKIYWLRFSKKARHLQDVSAG